MSERNEKEVEVDFEVLNEDWNKYTLKDGSKMKARMILTRVFKDSIKPNEYAFEFATPLFSVFAPEELMGKGGHEPEKTEWESLPAEEVEFETVKEIWNEYKINDRNNTVKIKYNVSRIKRITDRYDNNGRPFYVVNGAPAVSVSKE